MNKQIEDMRKFVSKIPYLTLEQTTESLVAQYLVNEGYRRASEVAREIVNDVKETLLDFHLREGKKYSASKAKTRKQFEIETARYRAITDAIKFAIEALNEIEKKYESEGGE